MGIKGIELKLDTHIVYSAFHLGGTISQLSKDYQY